MSAITDRDRQRYRRYEPQGSMEHGAEIRRNRLARAARSLFLRPKNNATQCFAVPIVSRAALAAAILQRVGRT